jgi:PAS domain S-box-containing protein
MKHINGSKRSKLAALWRYGLAVILVAAAVALTFLLHKFLSVHFFFLIVAAVMASVWFGGKGPGWLATVLSVLAVDYFFIPPLFILKLHIQILPFIAAFGISAMFAGLVRSKLKRREAALRQARDELETKVKERTAELTKAVEGLRESEERFRTMADSAPVMIWVSGTDKLCTYFNKSWLEFTGRTMEQEAGKGWAEGVHTDDLDYCLNTYITAFDARQEFAMEYRLRRFDGEYHWILENGTPRFLPDGEFQRYIGSCIEITDRKWAEEALKVNFAQLSKKNRYETIISTVTRSVHESINLQEVLENAIESMSKNIDKVQHIAIYLVEGEEAVIRAYRGFSDWFIKRGEEFHIQEV